jgi:hypothetical protein
MESLTVFPNIEVRMTEHLYIHIQGQDIIEVSKEIFTEKFDSCLNFIDTL